MREVLALDWSCDGTFLAAAVGRRLMVYFYDKQSNSLTEFSTAATSGQVNSVRWYPDGTRIVIGLNNSPMFGEVWLYDFNPTDGIVMTPAPLRAEHSANVLSVDVSPSLPTVCPHQTP